MSLPEFQKVDPELTRSAVINQIIASIAMEELGLSHIINAEGEKIQYALGTLPGVTGLNEPPTIEQLLELNDSVRATLDSTMLNQIYLKAKLQSALAEPIPGSACRCCTSYAEAVADNQPVESGGLIAFDVDTFDSVGKNIKISDDGKILTITKKGFYHIEWNINVASFNPAETTVIAGITKDGQSTPGSSCAAPGNLASGTLFEVKEVPYTIGLSNFGDPIVCENTEEWPNSAASIRIIRLAGCAGS